MYAGNSDLPGATVARHIVKISRTIGPFTYGDENHPDAQTETGDESRKLSILIQHAAAIKLKKKS